MLCPRESKMCGSSYSIDLSGPTLTSDTSDPGRTYPESVNSLANTDIIAVVNHNKFY